MKNKVCGIYLIIRKGTAHFYVGSSLDVENRLRKHKWALRAGTHQNKHLQNAFNLYGEDGFSFELFEEFPPDQVRHFEQVALDAFGKLPFCYNIAMDAIASMTGREPSAETKAKISSALKEKKKSQETKAKMSEAKKNNTYAKGMVHSQETLVKLREAGKNNTNAKGKKRSPETLAKMSAAQTKRQARERLERERALKAENEALKALLSPAGVQSGIGEGNSDALTKLS